MKSDGPPFARIEQPTQLGSADPVAAGAAYRAHRSDVERTAPGSPSGSRAVRGDCTEGWLGCSCSGLDVEAFAPALAWRAGWAECRVAFHLVMLRPGANRGGASEVRDQGGASPALARDLLVARDAAYLLVGGVAMGGAPISVNRLRLRATAPWRRNARRRPICRVSGSPTRSSPMARWPRRRRLYRSGALAALNRSPRCPASPRTQMFAEVQAGPRGAAPTRIPGSAANSRSWQRRG